MKTVTFTFGLLALALGVTHAAAQTPRANGETVGIQNYASTTAILSGEVKVGFGTVPNILPLVKTGKLKAYVVSGRKRFPGAPDIPTAAESGLPGLELEFWIGMLAPARTPSALVARLNRDIGEILQTPALQTTLLAQGAEAAPGTPAEFAAFIKSESAKMKRLIELTGMRVD